MTSKKLQALDAIKSLVVTATKWVNQEFPEPDQGVEEQTIREILNNLSKVNIGLENLLMYEKGLSDGLTVVAAEPRVPITGD